MSLWYCPLPVTRTRFLLLAGVLMVAALGASPAASSAACVQPYCPSHTLTVVRAGFGSGAVASSPAGIECGAKCAAPYQEGTAVSLTAKAAAGSVFTGWSGGGCHGTKACVVTIVADTTVTATFRPKGNSRGGELPEAIAHVTRRRVPVRRGKAKLRLRCDGDAACHGTLKLTTRVRRGHIGKGHRRKRRRIVIGRAHFDLAAGASAAIKVKLNRRGRHILKKRRKLKAIATGPGLVSSKVKLKPVKRHHRNHRR
jgi:hypothetical protein